MLFATTKSAISGAYMKFNDIKIKHICQKVLDRLKEHNIVVMRAEERQVLAAMAAAFDGNLKEELAIELEAKKLLEAHRGQMPDGMNQSKMFLMIKKELAKKRGFIL